MSSIVDIPGRSLKVLWLSIMAAMCSLAISGCVQTQAIKDPGFIPRQIDSARVLVMNPDVELSILMASGLKEPHAQWSDKGLANVELALDSEFKERKIKLIPYHPPKEDSQQTHKHNQLLKLHQAVGVTILRHKYLPALMLPTKQNRSDWSLGPYAKELREQYDADYAMFIFMRDSYASSGRVASMILFAALGVGIQGGIQVGFASIIDLRSGDIIWFNRLIDTTGDLRDTGASRKAIKSLLKDAPL